MTGKEEEQRRKGNRFPPQRLFGAKTSQEVLRAGVSSPSRGHLHGPGLVATWSLSPRWQQAGTLLEVSACGLAGRRLLVGTAPLRWTGSHTSLLSPVLMRGPKACQPQGSVLAPRKEVSGQKTLSSLYSRAHVFQVRNTHQPCRCSQGRLNPLGSLQTQLPALLGAPQPSDYARPKHMGPEHPLCTWGLKDAPPQPRPGSGLTSAAESPAPTAPAMQRRAVLSGFLASH